MAYGDRIDALVFDATVVERTGGEERPGRIPSESRLLEVNPSRRVLILRVTGWEDLCSGTLNIDLASHDIDRVRGGLLLETPAFAEPGQWIQYPPEATPDQRRIPMEQIGYLYYWGVLAANGQRQQILLRRTIRPALGLRRRLEALSSTSLMEVLRVHNGGKVRCEVGGDLLA